MQLISARRVRNRRGADRAGDAGATDESCLFLNVWTEALAGKRPVMVWIHGGAFRLGSGSMPIYDGTRFAKRGIVLVTLNYRLGRFGFFAHPALSAANPARRAGQLRPDGPGRRARMGASEHRGSAATPDNVTVFGESAGGASVLHLLTSPKAEGLFQKAIIESGGGHQLDRRLDSARGTKQSLNDQGVAWAKSVGAADATALAGAHRATGPRRRTIIGRSRRCGSRDRRCVGNRRSRRTCWRKASSVACRC